MIAARPLASLGRASMALLAGLLAASIPTCAVAQISDPIDPSPFVNESRTEQGLVDISRVPDPRDHLINLTVYNNGRDIGRVADISFDKNGLPERVEIAFNDNVTVLWVPAGRVRYDEAHRLVRSSLNPDYLKALEQTRIR